MPKSTANQPPVRFNWYLWERFMRRPSANSYSRAFARLDELPEAACQSVSAELLPGEMPRQIIFAPYQTVMGNRPVERVRGVRLLPWEYTRDRVIVLTGRRLLAVDLDDNGQQVETYSAPLERISYLQAGKILLHSWLEWTWEQGGKLERLRCYFNTVCEQIYFLLAEEVRGQWVEALPEGAPNRQGLELLSGLSYKFRNMLPLYLLPDECIEQVIFRPSCWERRAGFWRVHTLANAVLLLTNAHLLLAVEDLTHEENAYGLIVTYLPRQHIRAARLEQGEAGLKLAVTVGLGEAEETLRAAVQPELRLELTRLIARFGG